MKFFKIHPKISELVNLNIPILTWRNFPKVLFTFGKLKERVGVLLNGCSLNPSVTCFLLVLMTSSCIEEYTNKPNLKAEVLIVDGLITNQLEADTIEISFSKGNGVSGEITPVKNCKLSVISDDGKAHDLKEDLPGKYYTPSDLVKQIGKSYQLKMTTPNGENYESNFEKMSPVTSISKVYDVFDPKAILKKDGKSFRLGNKVYIDFQDPADEANNYLFRYKYYEQIAFCKSCGGGVLLGDGVTCLSQKVKYYLYDYVCSTYCWDIIYENSINVFSDVFTNGSNIKGQLVATIPWNNFIGALIEVKQYSISAEGYRFYNLLALQGNKTGSLTDTPPSPIVGNIKNINKPEETVVGFFGASSVSSVRYNVDRKANIGDAEQYLGHFPVLEDEGLIPNQAKCVESRTRTKIKPIGWPR
jgi:hypothetical protein